MNHGRYVRFQGGTLVEYDGKLRLLEIAQVPKERVGLFLKVFFSRHCQLLWHPLIIIGYLLMYFT